MKRIDTHKAEREALKIPTVKRARIITRMGAIGGIHGHVSGTVYDDSVGIEFDVEYRDRRWVVSDDEGRLYRSRFIKRALYTAIIANQ